MTNDQAVAFFVFSVVAAATPGPSNVLMASVGAQIGFVRGLPSLFGVTLGMGFLMFVTAFGFGSILQNQTMILTVLNWIGAAILLWLAWKIGTAGAIINGSMPRFAGFWKAAAFQWLNPKSWVVSVSAVGSYLRAGDTSALSQALLFGLIFSAAALPGCSTWLGFGASVQRIWRSEQNARFFNYLMGFVLASSVVYQFIV